MIRSSAQNGLSARVTYVDVPKKDIMKGISGSWDQRHVGAAIEGIPERLPASQFAQVGLDLIETAGSTKNEISIAHQVLDTLEEVPETAASVRLAFAMADNMPDNSMRRLALFQGALTQATVATTSQVVGLALSLLDKVGEDSAQYAALGAARVLQQDFFPGDEELAQVAGRRVPSALGLEEARKVFSRLVTDARAFESMALMLDDGRGDVDINLEADFIVVDDVAVERN